MKSVNYNLPFIWNNFIDKILCHEYSSYLKKKYEN